MSRKRRSPDPIPAPIKKALEEIRRDRGHGAASRKGSQRATRKRTRPSGFYEEPKT